MSSAPVQYSTVTSGNNSDGEREGAKPKVPRRTPMACQFCRGRKLKCDGRSTCANCERRGIPCVYVPVAAQNRQ
ncbi:hypothetical protein K466DRAFT_582161 [Polyporus arcularius HHB13444]|uniref:Zn(2)-C6 fungal-type domain-containing protein n=2 Tax=Polyporaceae TaxID=5317 RepID=A0A5C3PU43_9APHY|nr:hypothetical protein OH76DRAFT_1405722 [Polyporus brumalis]TFK92159.1 hypothetical protein K466DRAFT_582161 [Polyporus arcularius HHB13444]